MVIIWYNIEDFVFYVFKVHNIIIFAFFIYLFLLYIISIYMYKYDYILRCTLLNRICLKVLFLLSNQYNNFIYEKNTLKNLFKF